MVIWSVLFISSRTVGIPRWTGYAHILYMIQENNKTVSLFVVNIKYILFISYPSVVFSSSDHQTAEHCFITFHLTVSLWPSLQEFFFILTMTLQYTVLFLTPTLHYFDIQTLFFSDPCITVHSFILCLWNWSKQSACN